MTNVKKKLRKRWGRNFKDQRDWKKYNEHLVRQGTIFLDFDFVAGWENELENLNRGKVGAPYRFPKSLIELQALWHAKNLPYRMIEGLTRTLMQLGHLPCFDDYSTINRRVNQLDFTLSLPDGKDLCVFSDGTGFQAVNGGEYLRDKYGKKNRQWIQIILLGEAETHQPVSFEVRLLPTSEADSTQRQIKKLKRSGVKIKIAGGDGGLDKKDLWTFLDQNGIKPVIKPDKNALNNTECTPRNQAVNQRNQMGYKKWAKKHGYGHRWPATEGIFSAIKRIFKEQIQATSETGMLQETACKIWAYQKIQKT